MNMTTTRLATLADLPSVATLFDAYRQFYNQAADITVARSFIQERMQKQDSVILLALQGENVVGFCQLYPVFCSIEAKPIYLLSDLFVIPTGRRSGAGAMLLRAAEKHAADTGRVRMELTTAWTNKAAQTLYELQGWRRDEIFCTYHKRVDLLP